MSICKHHDWVSNPMSFWEQLSSAIGQIYVKKHFGEYIYQNLSFPISKLVKICHHVSHWPKCKTMFVGGNHI